ncbi:MAG: hypothetical protein EZS28_030877 [Streblomastix strix]|uniref:RRM domain-containing protein n=1 Tax=Streblomastix strix TaxID=222440 RepID=A0A5J4USF5_9EUKA|nr:MAG: hypothetical protein EZS28_030877 [Streblomastix strix]
MTFSLFIGNLNENTSAETIGKLFETIGEIEHATIITLNGRPRGFGKVKMINFETAYKAQQQFDKYEIDGREIRVEFPEDMNWEYYKNWNIDYQPIKSDDKLRLTEQEQDKIQEEIKTIVIFIRWIERCEKKLSNSNIEYSYIPIYSESFEEFNS